MYDTSNFLSILGGTLDIGCCCLFVFGQYVDDVNLYCSPMGVFICCCFACLLLINRWNDVYLCCSPVVDAYVEQGLQSYKAFHCDP